MIPTIRYTGKGVMHITAPAFRAQYLGELFRSKSAPALIPLFGKACDPAKEWTESYAAWHKLRRWLRPVRTVLHIGDGAHARTAALFAYHSGHKNISIDPQCKPEVVRSWEREIGNPTDRLTLYAGTVEAWLAEYGAVLPMVAWDAPVLLTFVHAHVDTTHTLASLPRGSWAAAYVCACCDHRGQLVADDDPRFRITEQGEDWAILSPERRYQVVVPR